MLADSLDIVPVADQLGIPRRYLRLYGHDKAKVDLAWMADLATRSPGKLVLVTGMTPTPAGEGKTTTSIGLADGLARIGQRAALSLREPSLGPCLGRKGGGTGHGKSVLVPEVDINLHFTGDFHAVSSAHNYLAALLDNHMHFNAAPVIAPERVLWRRVMDMNERALRDIEAGRGKGNGPVRSTGFDITAASEIMAVLALARDENDLRARLGRMVVAEDQEGHAITASMLGAVGGMMALLKDAIHPNLVQTLEGTPAFVHAGPFANIAHGASSVIATRMALGSADWVVTEAGFGFDLGGEKFFDLVCPVGGFAPSLVVIVATLKALKMHGGKPLDALGEPDADAVKRGIVNLEKHIENIRRFGRPCVVALNCFPGDNEKDREVLEHWALEHEVPLAVSRHAADGGAGAKLLAEAVVAHAAAPAPLTRLYQDKDDVRDKVWAIATAMYGAQSVHFTEGAVRDLGRFAAMGFAALPICMAKTPSSLSDQPDLYGRPSGFDITVRKFELSAGAGFLVALTGDIMRMPGLPKRPRGLDIDLKNGRVEGLL